MTLNDYKERILSISSDNLMGWVKLAEDLRVQGAENRPFDAQLTLIMQGLALQIDRYAAHVGARQAQFNREIEIVRNAEPIDSSPDLTV